ncbi:MAG: hypothetical protein ABL977_03020 [Candidatus Eisenbacteria bacterium]
MTRTRESLDELMQRVLEGEASSAEQLELQAELARDPAAHTRFAAQADAFERLAQLELPAAPPGLHDAVMAQVRATPVASTTPHRAPGAALRRWAFPAVAAAVALVLLWFTAGPRAGGGPGRAAAPGPAELAGTMAQANIAGVLTLGEGDGALQVHWKRERGGFVLQLESGAEPVEVEVTALTPGSAVRLEFAAELDSTFFREFNVGLPAHRSESCQVTATTPSATLRIQAKFPDGRAVGREITITGLQDAAPGPGEPTSAPPAGH